MSLFILWFSLRSTRKNSPKIEIKASGLFSCYKEWALSQKTERKSLVVSKKLTYIANLEKVSRIGLRYFPHDFSAKDLEGD